MKITLNGIDLSGIPELYQFCKQEFNLVQLKKTLRKSLSHQEARKILLFIIDFESSLLRQDEDLKNLRDLEQVVFGPWEKMLEIQLD